MNYVGYQEKLEGNRLNKVKFNSDWTYIAAIKCVNYVNFFQIHVTII